MSVNRTKKDSEEVTALQCDGLLEPKKGDWGGGPGGEEAGLQDLVGAWDEDRFPVCSNDNEPCCLLNDFATESLSRN